MMRTYEEKKKKGKKKEKKTYEDVDRAPPAHAVGAGGRGVGRAALSRVRGRPAGAEALPDLQPAEREPSGVAGAGAGLSAEIGNRKSEIGNWKSEIGNRKSEIGNRNRS